MDNPEFYKTKNLSRKLSAGGRGKPRASDDELASDATLDALRTFLEKFPVFVGRDMYITGESYAGVYVPTLAKRVVESEIMGKVNFKVRSSSAAMIDASS